MGHRGWAGNHRVTLYALVSRDYLMHLMCARTSPTTRRVMELLPSITPSTMHLSRVWLMSSRMIPRNSPTVSSVTSCSLVSPWSPAYTKGKTRAMAMIRCFINPPRWQIKISRELRRAGGIRTGDCLRSIAPSRQIAFVGTTIWGWSTVREKAPVEN